MIGPPTVLERWRPLLRYLVPHRGMLAWGTSALALATVCLLAAPVLLKDGIATIETAYEAGTEVDWTALRFYALAALAVTLVGALASFFKRYLLVGASRKLEADLRRDVFAHLQRLPTRYFDTTRTGDLMSRVTADVEVVRMGIGPSFMYLADAVLRLGGALVIMLAVDAQVTLWALSPMLGLCAGLFVLAPRIHKASRAVQDQLAAISARTQESMAGARVVKSFATEPVESEAMEALSQGYVDANVALARVRGVTGAWVTLMGGASMLLILWIGGRRIIEGTFSVAELTFFFTYQFLLIWPLMAFGWVLSLLQRGAAGADRLAEVFAQEPETDAAAPGPGLAGHIRADGLTFAYDDGRPVLTDVSCEVPAGATLGIVGPTGSGKSTFARLLARLYDPPPGALFVDGRDAHDVPLAELRAGLAFVPQEAFLFSATLRENLAFGRPGAPDDVVQAAAADARLAADLEDFPQGLETRVGERGVTLSGGQKQRAALARALVTDAPILVLDDALSAVDAETEAAILANLKRHREGRTAIVIAHRVSAVRDADEILVLREGRVVERGTHEKLVAVDGEYARLARMQELEAEIEAME